MSNVMVDTDYPDSDDALRLCRMLDEPLADALPMRLWCWGIKTERSTGRFEADAKQLAQIVRFTGAPEALLEAFLSCNVIEKTDETNVFRICGWKRNARYFKERERLRSYSSTKKPRVDHASPTQKPRVNHKDPSSSSSSPSTYVEGSTPAPIETTRGAAAIRVTSEQAAELYEHWQDERERRRGVPKVLMPSTTAIDQARPVLVNAGGDMMLARAVTTILVNSDHKFWVEKGWGLWLLGDIRDFEKARALISPSTKPRAERVAEEERKRKERFDREEQEARAQWEAEQRAKGDADGRPA